MKHDANAELHARPSIYFSGPALVEHFALMSDGGRPATIPHAKTLHDTDDLQVRFRVEHHTEFVTVTRVARLPEEPQLWPETVFTREDAEEVAGMTGSRLIHRVAILVLGPAPSEHGEVLRRFGLGVSAGSYVGGKAAQVVSDFQVRSDGSSRMLLFNHTLNAYRLGRMVRRLYEIEAYRAMALLGLPEARALGPVLADYDADLVALSGRHVSVAGDEHRALLEDISGLSARVVSAAARTRHRFGATAAYAKIVEERIGELREERIEGFQRFGVFVDRRFKPAVRTCEATALRLEQLSQAAMLLVDLLQTRIQVEVQFQNKRQMELMVERTAVQLKIQRAVEGLSIIAITYYLVALMKSAIEAASHAGWDIDPRVTLVIIPICLCAVFLAVRRVRKALSE